MLDISRFNLFAGKSYRELVGVDLSAGHLKLSSIRYSPAKAEVVNLLSRSIGGLADPDIAKVVNSAFHSLHLKRPTVIVTLPSSLVITKNIEIPSSNPKEIREIINLQAGRHTPYSREEIIVDYLDIGTYKHSYTKILLVIVARSVIRRHFDILGKAGLRPERVFFSAEGFAHLAGALFKINTDASPATVIHVDEASTDFVVLLREKVLFVRSIPIGTQHLVFEKDKTLARFTEEVKRSLEAYQSEDIDRSPTTLILTGGIEEMGDLEAALSHTLHLPVRNAPYARNLAITPEALAAISADKRISFFGIIAPLFSFGTNKIDLVPEEAKVRKTFEEKGKELIRTGILVFAILILTFSILINKMYFKNLYLKGVRQKYQALSEAAKKLEKDYARVSLARSYLSGRGYSLEALTELYSIAPLDLELSSIRLDDKGRFTVAGTAQTMSTVFSFVDNMDKSKYFKEVKTKYTSKRKEATRDVTDFEIVALIDKERAKK